MILVPVTYKGGVYRLDEGVDYIEDLGGLNGQRDKNGKEGGAEGLEAEEEI